MSIMTTFKFFIYSENNVVIRKSTVEQDWSLNENVKY